MRRALSAALLCAGCFDWGQFASFDGAVAVDFAMTDFAMTDFATSEEDGAAGSDGAVGDLAPPGPIDLAGHVWQTGGSIGTINTLVTLTGNSNNLYAAGNLVLAGSIAKDPWAELAQSGDSYSGVFVDANDVVWSVAGGLARYALDPMVATWTGSFISDSTSSFHAIWGAPGGIYITGKTGSLGVIWTCLSADCTLSGNWQLTQPTALTLGAAIWGSSAASRR
jgi:hypothetical protein